MYVCMYLCIYLSIYLSIYITPVGGPGWVGDVDCTSSRCAPKTDHNTHIYGYICIYIGLTPIYAYAYICECTCLYVYIYVHATYGRPR